MAEPLFRRVLIANRGEIAIRVIRACHELGIGAVAVYGEDEEQSPHVRLADDAYRLRSGTKLPYLDFEAILDVAVRAEVDGIHPGYGFLSENADFAAAVTNAGLVFVGPSAEVIRAMGNKVEARRRAIEAGVPVAVGSPGPIASVEEAAEWASANGYPVAVKAAGGGGGRGFRVALDESQLADAFRGSTGEAQRYFSNPTVYMERYLSRPRHIEVQLFGDAHGSVVALGERDCSVQRRHQKLVEETPSPSVDGDTRARLFAAAIALGKAVGYTNAGTCEFLLSEAGELSFLEMNTRIQVEHTVTEEVTGIDLVKEQFRVAAGLPLSFCQESLRVEGHAIQCRINAEDPGRDFKPTPGVLSRFQPPAGFRVRVDSAAETGGVISPNYDSLIAKLVVWGRDRQESLDRMRRALDEFVIEGIPTTLPLHRNIMSNAEFRTRGATTAFLQEFSEVIPPAAIVESVEAVPEQAEYQDLLVEVNGRRFVVRAPASVGSVTPAITGNRASPVRPKSDRSRQAAGSSATGPELRSPIQGTVVRVGVEVGRRVERGDFVCSIEAMKMENEISAHRAGTVADVSVQPGQSVGIGALIVRIDD